MNIGADVVFCGLAAALFLVGIFCWAKGAINATWAFWQYKKQRIKEGDMFALKRWRKRREWPEPVLDEDKVELIFDEPTYDDLKALFEELIFGEPTYDDPKALSEESDYEIEIKEERAENRVENLKSHKTNLYGKCI